ncbi:hypothetical protein CAter10_2111 [Collimonas arenae]|nr:hypothetical protein CAter10_2111 [Collimonas arenae]
MAFLFAIANASQTHRKRIANRSGDLLLKLGLSFGHSCQHH